MHILSLLNEIGNTSSTKSKSDLVKKILDSDQKDLFIKIFHLTYDRVKYTFGITTKSLTKFPDNIDHSKNNLSIYNSNILDSLSKLYNRELTGNKAIEFTQNLLNSLNEESHEILWRIIDRDLRLGFNVTQFNKLTTNKISVIPYMRCSLTDKLKNIKYPAILQKKMDGTYRTFIVTENSVDIFSRSGEPYSYHELESNLIKLEPGVYVGEVIVRDSEDRYKSNGLLNSLNVPENLDVYLWDYISLQDFSNKESKKPYKERLKELEINISTYKSEKSNVKVVDYIMVQNYSEALNQTKIWMNQGEEGSILKDQNASFKDGTSTKQIKLKLEFDIDVKITGYLPGKGKRADTIGSILFESSDGIVKGSVSGFKDSELDYIFNNKESLIGTVMTIIGTDLTKDNSILHPRFKCLRDDKLVADDLPRIQNIIKMVLDVKA